MITWAEIKNECGDYRAGFVAVFKQYEGQETDERDERGRVVKVTATSFARNVGIPIQTFSDWIKRHDQITGAVIQDSVKERRIRGDVRRDPDAVAREIIRNPEARAVVTHELAKHYDRERQLRRTETPIPAPSAYDASLELLVRLRAISTAIKAATDLVMTSPRYGDTDDLVAIVEWQTNALGILRDVLAGRTDMDSELAQILGEG